MNIRDLSSGLFWLGISTFVCVKSNLLGIGTFRSPAPGFFPFWAGALLGMFAIFVMVKSFLLKKKGGKKIADLWKGMEWHKVIYVLFSLFVYVILLPKLGFLIATFGLMTFLFGIKGRPRLWLQAVSAIVIVLATYVIFHFWLEVQLPRGLLGF